MVTAPRASRRPVGVPKTVALKPRGHNRAALWANLWLAARDARSAAQRKSAYLSIADVVVLRARRQNVLRHRRVVSVGLWYFGGVSVVTRRVVLAPLADKDRDWCDYHAINGRTDDLGT